MSLSAHVVLEIEGFSEGLRVTRLNGTEALHASFEFELTVLGSLHSGNVLSLDSEALLGAVASVTLVDEPSRIVRGIVDQIQATPGGYNVTVVSCLAPLADVVDYRVFVDSDAVSIARKLLSEHGISVGERFSRIPEKRAQCVQAWESTLHFVGRILADEGIVFVPEVRDDANKLVFVDGPQGVLTIDGEHELPFGARHEGGLRGADSVYSIHLRRRTTVDKVTLSDFDFERPTLNPTSSVGQGPLEHFEPLAGARTADLAAKIATIRQGELNRQRVTLTGRTSCRRLSPGRTFKLSGAPHPGQNGEWLLVSVTHEGRDLGAGVPGAPAYEASFVAVPAEVGYRPPRSKAPMEGGLQMGTITGPSGSEIFTEAQGRVKTLLRWDRRGKEDDSASAWIRPVQPPLSGGFFLPRVGWESLFGFGRTAADEPYQLGRLDNGVHLPAENLPAQKIRSAFGSKTTPGGGSQNLLLTDDAAGVEGFALVASKDLNEKTENDKGVTITANETVAIGANHTEIVAIQQTVVVAGAQSLSVGGNRDMTTTGQFVIQAASESVSVGGSRQFQVGGDMGTTCASLTRAVGAAKTELAIEEQNRHVSGAHTVAAGAGWVEIAGLSSAVSVLGQSSLSAGGPIVIQTANYSLSATTLNETYGAKNEAPSGARVHASDGSLTLKVGGALSLKGSLAVFDAGSIKISAGGVTIQIGGGTITIDGKLSTSGSSLVTGNETHE